MKMRMMAVAKKEVLQLLRDRRIIPMVLLVPILQVILFGYVVAAEIKNINFAVLDGDRSTESRQIVSKIEHSGYFIKYSNVNDYQELEKLLDGGKVKLGLVIMSGFKRQMLRNEAPTLQVLVDGTDSNTSAIAQTHLMSILNQHATELMNQKLIKVGFDLRVANPLNLRSRIYYNPELRMVNFMVPGVMAQVLLLITTMLTALAIVREKEVGTIEQLMVTPLKPWELMVGKLLPFPIIGLLDAILAMLVGLWWFKVPIVGNLWLLLAGTSVFLITTLGMGLLISTLSSTQQQAMLSTIFFLIPNMLLSGFIFPIANMPKFLQYVTLIIPARYFIEIIRGIYIKGLGLNYLYPQFLALFVLGIAVLFYAVKNFRKQLV